MLGTHNATKRARNASVCLIHIRSSAEAGNQVANRSPDVPASATWRPGSETHHATKIATNSSSSWFHVKRSTAAGSQPGISPSNHYAAGRWRIGWEIFLLQEQLKAAQHGEMGTKPAWQLVYCQWRIFESASSWKLEF